MNKLQKTIHFINNTSLSFQPIQILEYVEGTKDYHNSTIYNYINHLHKCEYIKRVNTGTYIRCAIIPSYLTTTLLKKMAYDDDFKVILDRKKKLNKLLGKNDNVE